MTTIAPRLVDRGTPPQQPGSPRSRSPLSRILGLFTTLLLLPVAAQAQLPSPTYGWNLGNTMEATWVTTPTAPPQSMINAVADAGFNTIRIPCAWDHNANQSTMQINASYIADVKKLVDWSLARNMTVIINAHWDKGWLDSTLATGYSETVNTKMRTYWTQIANTFKNYDNRLLFAGANEPPVEDATQMATLLRYYQTFVNAVRGTGGNNASRWLVLSGPYTDLEKTDKLMNTLPTDSATGRLAVEVHFYGPYNFAQMKEDADWGKASYFWGKGYHHATRTDRNSTWGEEDWIESQLNLMVNKFLSRGIPVIVGEFGAIRRTGHTDLTGADLNLHLASRTYWNKVLVEKANAKGLKPIYWDDGGTDPDSFGLFNRSNSTLVDRDVARVVTGGAALPPPGGGGIVANGIYKIVARHSGKALEVASFGKTNGSNVQQWSYAWGENQRWVITHLGNNQYSIVGAQSGKALDVSGAKTANGTNVLIWAYNGAANQKWTLTATSEGYYRLTPSHATGSCLDVNGVSTADGANVQIWSYVGGANQQWKFEAP
ncbi:MAG TPA: cellulase family glycosylhydrolase [Opitutaceae bacterium]|nr:cellulase family glycosylhydrolase [Opitutaceae bacterium]